MRINADPDPELYRLPIPRLPVPSGGFALALALSVNGIVAFGHLVTFLPAPAGSEVDVRAWGAVLIPLMVLDLVLVLPIIVISMVRRPSWRGFVAFLLAIPPLPVAGTVAYVLTTLRGLTLDT